MTGAIPPPAATAPTTTTVALPKSPPPEPNRMPGLEIVGHGIGLRPGQPYVLKDILFERRNLVPHYCQETGLAYGVPEGYQVDDSPPMPESQALNQVIIEESWDRFDKRTSISASAAVSGAPFSVDINASQLAQVRQEEDSYYALRTSFVPLWALYVPNTTSVSDEYFEIDIPTPFSQAQRMSYQKFFERYGTHYVSRAWAGGKAMLALTISKQSQISISDIQAGIKASAPGLGSAGVSTDLQQSKQKLQSNSQCMVFGEGGDQLKLAALSSLDERAYNDWIVTVCDNPEVIEFEAVGIWSLLQDAAKAEALRLAYQEETVFSPIRVIFNLDNKIHFFDDFTCYTFDSEKGETTKPVPIKRDWGQLIDIGFERVDSAFLGKYLQTSQGEDLNRKLFLFNRDMYVRWDVDAKKIDPGYPKLITEGWPGVDFPRIDTAVNVSSDAVYFFCGNRYTRFNMKNNHTDDGYPDFVSRRWTGVTFDRIDAGTYWGNGKIYFFHDNQYIRYDTVMWRTDPGYPKTIVGNYVEDWKDFE